MQRCLELAMKGIGNVAPNPLVGSIIVYFDKVIGEGYHQQYGQAHAEVNAINSVADKELLKQSTLYVNLEPCSHFGKTPPCADLIIKMGIPRVVIGSNDPNPEVAGKGIRKLREAGVEVVTGVLEDEADFLNRRFITFHTLQRPYIILKWAQSADGIMAPKEPKQLWLTNEQSKKLVHQWRSEEQAILIGGNTLMADEPKLTVRLVSGKNPLRIVISRHLSSTDFPQAFFAEKVPTWIFNELVSKKEGEVEFIKVEADSRGMSWELNMIQAILRRAYDKGIQSIIIEGGPATLQHFVNTGLWDEARIFTTPHILKEGKAAPVLAGQIIHEENIEGDELQVVLNI